MRQLSTIWGLRSPSPKYVSPKYVNTLNTIKWSGTSRMQHPRPYSDTNPAAMAVWINLLRMKSDGEKIAAVFGLIDLAWEMAEIGVRSRYPGASDREIFLRTAALRLSRDEMIRAYQWDPLGS